MGLLEPIKAQTLVLEKPGAAAMAEAGSSLVICYHSSHSFVTVLGKVQHHDSSEWEAVEAESSVYCLTWWKALAEVSDDSPVDANVTITEVNVSVQCIVSVAHHLIVSSFLQCVPKTVCLKAIGLHNPIFFHLTVSRFPNFFV